MMIFANEGVVTAKSSYEKCKLINELRRQKTWEKKWTSWLMEYFFLSESNNDHILIKFYSGRRCHCPLFFSLFLLAYKDKIFDRILLAFILGFFWIRYFIRNMLIAAPIWELAVKSSSFIIHVLPFAYQRPPALHASLQLFWIPHISYICPCNTIFLIVWERKCSLKFYWLPFFFFFLNLYI